MSIATLFGNFILFPVLSTYIGKSMFKFYFLFFSVLTKLKCCIGWSLIGTSLSDCLSVNIFWLIIWFEKKSSLFSVMLSSYLYFVLLSRGVFSRLSRELVAEAYKLLYSLMFCIMRWMSLCLFVD